MPGGSKKGGGLTTKRSAFYKMKRAPYKHTGSASHPTGAISAHKGHRTIEKKLKKVDIGGGGQAPKP